MNAREERGHFEILILRPTLKGMVMALGANHARSHEHLRRFLHRRLRVARSPVVIRFRRLVTRPAGGNQLPYPGVIRLIRRQGLANPLAESVSSLLTQEFAARLQ